jgi:hypothetical protein
MGMVIGDGGDMDIIEIGGLEPRQAIYDGLFSFRFAPSQSRMKPVNNLSRSAGDVER